MDEYPEELLTPPVPLVALVGMPEIHLQVSTFLSANQPSIVSISILDPQEATILAGKEKRPLEARLPPPVGIIKSGWLKKHREKSAGAVALFLDRDLVHGDPGQWLAVCAEIDAIK